MKPGGLTVAVVGPRGLIGSELVDLLRERQFPLGELRLLGSVRTAGGQIEYEGRREPIVLLGPSSFTGVDLAFFAAGPALAGEHAPRAVEDGAAVIDLSSRFRLDQRVPLVVPEVNPAAIAERREQGIVACPSAVATGLSVVLAPLAAEAGIRRAVVATYQGAAGAGRRALNGLSRETFDLLNARGARRTRFPRRMAFNCIPQVGDIEPGGSTTHELRVVEETRRVLGIQDIALSVTAVRVPMFSGVGMSVQVETEQPLPVELVCDLLRSARGIYVHDEEADSYPTPTEVLGSDATHVGRVRQDPSLAQGIAFWVALDGVRKGTALNAVQIAEILVRDYL